MRQEKTYVRLMRNMDKMQRSRYANDVKQYSIWAEEHGLKRASDDQIKDSLKDYVAYRLTVEHRSPETVRHNLTGVLQALGVSLMIYDPDKGHDVRARAVEEYMPVVHKSIPVKGRQETSARARTALNSRITHFAAAVGIRKAEYADLKGKDLIEREGRLYVHVSRGKGGKEQYQYILPADEQIVREAFRGVSDEGYVFSRDEIRGCDHAGLHECRREHAQRAYDYFVSELQNQGKRDEMITWLRSRWADNPQKHWDRDVAPMLDKPYRARGAVRQALIAAGRPTVYDRLALLAVSNLELAHYRCDVAVKHYML